MKKMQSVRVVVVLFCLGLFTSQVVGSDNEAAQLAALGKKTDNSESKKWKDAFEGEVVVPTEAEKRELEQWKKTYEQEQERIRIGYEQ